MDHNNLMCENHTKCRVCKSTNLTEYLDLGLMPISNNLECSSELAKNSKKFPLNIMFCNECGLSQLSVVCIYGCKICHSHCLYQIVLWKKIFRMFHRFFQCWNSNNLVDVRFCFYHSRDNSLNSTLFHNHFFLID